MKETGILSIIFILIYLLIGCEKISYTYSVQKVGMLFEDSIHNNDWNKKGFEGLKKIQSEHDVDIFFQENVYTRENIIEAVDHFVNRGVNLIIGHSQIYGRVFIELQHAFPHIYFVYYNGGYTSERVKTYTFNTHALSFFSGMIASKMTKTNHVAIMSENKWQQEIEGFYEGAKFQDDTTNVHIQYLNNNFDEAYILDIYETLKDQNVDIFFPPSLIYRDIIIQETKGENAFVIDFFETTNPMEKPTNILTTVIYHVDEVYPYIVKQLNAQQLKTNNLIFDFHDDFISFGKFHDNVSSDYRGQLMKYVEIYKEKYVLPNEYSN